jgi:hypothetical protein
MRTAHRPDPNPEATIIYFVFSDLALVILRSNAAAILRKFRFSVKLAKTKNPHRKARAY